MTILLCGSYVVLWFNSVVPTPFFDKDRSPKNRPFVLFVVPCRRNDDETIDPMAAKTAAERRDDGNVMTNPMIVDERLESSSNGLVLIVDFGRKWQFDDQIPQREKIDFLQI